MSNDFIIPSPGTLAKGKVFAESKKRASVEQQLESIKIMATEAMNDVTAMYEMASPELKKVFDKYFLDKARKDQTTDFENKECANVLAQKAWEEVKQNKLRVLQDPAKSLDLESCATRSAEEFEKSKNRLSSFEI